MDRTTVDVYEQRGAEWAARRSPVRRDDALAFGRRVRLGGRRLDVGAGAGRYTNELGPPSDVVAFDAARTMLELLGDAAPGALRVQADLERLPLRHEDADAFVIVRTCVAEKDTAAANSALFRDLLGLLALEGTYVVYAAFPERFYLSENLGRMVAAGKTAFHLPDGGQPKIDPEIAALFQAGDSPSTADQVRERALAALAEEARLMLDEGVVAEAQDIDLCMITGAGWPFHLGGITPYLDRSGISKKVTGKRFLAPGVASVPPL